MAPVTTAGVSGRSSASGRSPEDRKTAAGVPAAVLCSRSSVDRSRGVPGVGVRWAFLPSPDGPAGAGPVALRAERQRTFCGGGLRTSPAVPRPSGLQDRPAPRSGVTQTGAKAPGGTRAAAFARRPPFPGRQVRRTVRPRAAGSSRRGRKPLAVLARRPSRVARRSQAVRSAGPSGPAQRGHLEVRREPHLRRECHCQRVRSRQEQLEESPGIQRDSSLSRCARWTLRMT